MTRQEFVEKYRGRLLVHLAEAWAVRRESPSQIGLIIDGHHRQIKELLADIYRDLCPPADPFGDVPAAGGHHNGRAR